MLDGRWVEKVRVKSSDTRRDSGPGRVELQIGVTLSVTKFVCTQGRATVPKYTRTVSLTMTPVSHFLHQNRGLVISVPKTPNLLSDLLEPVRAVINWES